ncbi:hypothetical protein ACJJID_12750 [Microbulbifer sp. CnH-101-G]|uniref:hypothetical protein n=1 Tax=Microbulbifer sp. CnH-101-G TaxID=3243393 RepID=UPI0040399627
MRRITFLKFKNGSPNNAILEMRPECNICQTFPKERKFSSGKEFDVYFHQVSDLKLAGKILSIKGPSWLNHDSSHIGAAAFFKCSGCGSVWDFAAPEKEFGGFWVRIV